MGAIFLVYCIITVVASVIPFVGQLVMVLFSPVFTAGFMVGFQAAEREEGVRFAHLFAGFKRNTGALIGVGALSFVWSLVLVLLAAVVLSVFMAGAGGLAAGMSDPQMAAAHPLAALLAVAVVLLLLVPLMMLLWFAPALVVLNGLGPWAAMKRSFAGCLENIMPFLVYGLVGLVLGILAILPLGLGWLVLGPVLFGSVYAGYRDIFTAD